MNVPPIGPVVPHPDVSEWLLSEPYELRCLLGQTFQFVLDAYVEDTHQTDYHVALRNLLELDSAALAAVDPYVVQYCNDTLSLYDEQDRPPVRLAAPFDVWKYVHFGSELHVVRRAMGDEEDGIYFSLECSCGWEQEHGLVLILRDGLAFTKVAPYDGHLTNADAYADPTLKGVIFKRFVHA